MNTTVELTVTEKAVQTLVELLTSPDPQTRMEAARTILELRRAGAI